MQVSLMRLSQVSSFGGTVHVVAWQLDVVGTANQIWAVYCYPAQLAEAHPASEVLLAAGCSLLSCSCIRLLLIRQSPYTLESGSGTCCRPICVAPEAKPPNLSDTR